MTDSWKLAIEFEDMHAEVPSAIYEAWTLENQEAHIKQHLEYIYDCKPIIYGSLYPNSLEETISAFGFAKNGKADYLIFTTGLGNDKINELHGILKYLGIECSEQTEMALDNVAMPIVRIPFAEMMKYSKFVLEFEKNMPDVRPVEHLNSNSPLNKIIREERASQQGNYEFFKNEAPRWEYM